MNSTTSPTPSDFTATKNLSKTERYGTSMRFATKLVCSSSSIFRLFSLEDAEENEDDLKSKRDQMPVPHYLATNR